MLMAMCMKVNGRTTKPMATECICMQMEPDMKETGKRISSTVKVSRDGQMERSTMENILRDKSTGEELFNGAIIQSSLANSKTITLRAMAPTNGTTVGSTTEIGKTIKCTVKVFSHGLMEESTLGLTKRI
jgi:hypothetical protein